MSKLGKILFLLSGVSMICFAAIRLIAGGWVPFLWIALGLTTLFVVTGFFVDRRFFAEFLSLKTTKQGLSMGAMTGLVLISLIAINVLGARRYTTWDFSLSKVNTLSDQSIQLLKSLKSDLKVIYFYKEGTEGVDQNRRAFIELIRKYQDQSENIKLEFVEINQRPDLTEKYQITKGSQAVILDYNGKTNLIEKIDEQELTGALVKVTREKSKKIYIVSGHRELNIEASQDGHSVSLLVNLLKGSNYEVLPLVLTGVPQIPTDADVVMILGPEQAYADIEKQMLENYLKAGGNLFLALEPGMRHGLEDFLSKLGIKAENNFIVTSLETPMGKMVDPRSARGSEFSKNNQITKPFVGNEFVLFRLPQSFSYRKPEQGDLREEDLVKTNKSTRGFKNLDFKNGENTEGPFTVAIKLDGVFMPGGDPQKPFQLALFGDADFINDQFFYQNLNRDLALNSVAALAKEENLIAISPKEVGTTQLELPDSTFYMFILGFVLPLPILFFVASGVVWFRRRYA